MVSSSTLNKWGQNDGQEYITILATLIAACRKRDGETGDAGTGRSGKAEISVSPRHPSPPSPFRYRDRWPICSVPKEPMPFRRKLKTTRFSLRSPTLNDENWPVTAQQSQL